MKKTTSIFLIGLFLIGIIGCSLLFIKNFSKEDVDFATPIGTLVTSPNDKLQSNINTYMELQKDKSYLGYENYHCSNYLFGYDSKYAYAGVLCHGFMSEEEKKNFDDQQVFKMSKDGKLTYGTGFSIPTRLEYVQPDFQIINFQQPKDGSQYGNTFRQLFPKKFYKEYHDYQRSGKEIKKLIQEVEDKARAQLNR